MKDGVREGLHLKCKKEEKEFVSEQEEATFWEKKLLGTTSAKSLLNTIYFYNGNVFGLRGGGHRNIVVNNFEIVTAFYFKPSKTKFAFDKVPVGVNSLNKILPEMCEAAGFKRKTAHSLRVTCVSSLFNAGMEEKLIRERSGHRTNALFQYEKPTEENVSKVSKTLGPSVSAVTGSTTEKQGESIAFKDAVFQKGKFKN